jgi:hypothetical protein
MNNSTKIMVVRWSIVAMIVFLVAIVLFMWMALGGLFRPGSLFFPLQESAEQTWSSMVSGEQARLDYSLTILERRRADLEATIGGASELIALQALNRSLDLTLIQMGDTDPGSLLAMRQDLLDRTMKVQKTFRRLLFLPWQDSVVYEAFYFKMKALQRELESGNMTQRAFLNIANLSLTKAPVAIAMGGSPGNGSFQHSLNMPLTGAHAPLACTQCHTDGVYAAGRSTDCASCHESKRPANHFTGDCATCHSPESGWTSPIFDHAQVDTSDCQSCHENQRPAGHYEGQCFTCHSPEGGWANPTFDHVQVATTDCQSCHESKRPADHYTGQCSTCHTPGAWIPANFNHTGYTDCQSCHAAKRPANHYTGQCSLCHTGVGVSWKTVTFNHTGYTDCQSCHAAKRPANHYNGQCSLCHTGVGVSWKTVTFNHTGYTDCQSCHAAKRPANHYNGQCSLCHTGVGVSWKTVTFNHTGYTDCQSCHAAQRPANHYSGQCSLCHTGVGVSWKTVTFNHTGYTDCQSCHAAQRPANHYSGQCSLCHTGVGVSWKTVTFNHTGYTDCQSCHAAQRPAGHLQGQCSLCHTPGAWLPTSFTHTFPLNHNGANSNCALCHTSAPPAYTCWGCHNQTELTKHHQEKNIWDITNCIACHPTGRKPNGLLTNPAPNTQNNLSISGGQLDLVNDILRLFGISANIIK